LEAGVEQAAAAIRSGAALAKFRELVVAQGGDVRYVDEPDRFPRADYVKTTQAPRCGHLAAMKASEIGIAVVALGGGREVKGQAIDHRVGVVMHVEVGDRVSPDTSLFTVHAATLEDLDAAATRILRCMQFSDSPADPLPLFYGRIA
jgi:pyrimidine-nucleoside phosphorylase